ncbi:MAG: holo-ACP synthase [Caldilineaceae bacterium]|nr:holo-ACP synthase [Caldilineaceae bacterium]
MLRTGVDLLEIERMRQAIDRHGEHFLRRVFTPGELAHCAGRVESLAARFAAKEAAAKALQSGVWRQGIGWTDLEVVADPESRAPTLCLHNAAARLAELHGLHHWSVSLSHDRTHAIAFVVALGG